MRNLKALDQAEQTVLVTKAIVEVGQEVGGIEVGDGDALMESGGLDSLGTIEVKTRLQDLVGAHVKLPDTLMFDYPTPRKMAGYVVQELQGSLHGLMIASNDPHSMVAPVSGLVRDLIGKNEEQQLELLVRTIVEAAVDVGGNEVGNEESLMENAGLDSLATIEVKSRLQEEFSADVQLSDTVLFDHPTPEKLARHLLSLAKPSTQKSNTAVNLTPVLSRVQQTPGRVQSKDNHVAAITGMACYAPGGCDTPAQLWELFCSGRDCVQKIPTSRWDVDALDGTEAELYVKHGHFIQGVELFDNEFFGLGSAEAKHMDPHQRLLLEVGYAAMSEAGYQKAQLMDSDAGVFVAIATRTGACAKGTGCGPTLSATWAATLGQAQAVSRTCSV